ncbi:MMPL family transporter [Pradoshia sp. D12]|uniref:MMPL family transporter n=1 Tax=Bacillaceae TaxID=186817 RepID=UPI00080AE892|nr:MULTISPECIES: MMPL family transporter [Bacillaceae]OCA90146.1 hypothetical protein A8L44_04275 [Bacillus sp. FJAT-27986]QFK70447.1 MMPL family transporter [Pradoshia sp. D12]TPF72242.1 MMPL family transporter [Bacillus sp. D12]
MMYTYRKIILVIWIIFTLVMGFFALKMPGILQGSGFEMEESSYDKTNELLEDRFGQSASPYIILFENKDNLEEKDFKQKINSVLNDVKKIDGFSSVESPLENDSQYKKEIAYASISFDEDTQEPADYIKALNQEIAGQDISASLTGSHVIEEDMSKASQTDLKNAEMIGIPIAMIVLLLAFGGLVAASIPLMTGIVAVVSSMGIIYFIGQSINLSVFVLNVVPMIGLAVSIDFALLYIHRFREELQHHEVSKAVSITNKTAGKAIAFSGTCVVLGLAGMFFINIDIFRSIAVGGIVAVFISVISALTFLPALLGIIGKNINKAMILKTKENSDSKWRSFANFVMKRPIIMALAALLILMIAATPIRNIDLEIPNADSLPADSQTRIAYEKFEDSFLPSNQSNVPIVLETKNQEDILSKESLENIEAFINELKEDELVDQVDSIFTYTNTNSAEELYQTLQSDAAREKMAPVLEKLVNEDTTHITVKLDAAYKTAKAKDWVREAENQDIHPELTHTIGGQAKFTQEIFDEILEQVPKGLLLIIGATYLILLVAFRSVLIPVKAILMNILSLGAAFGIIVWIFQHGNLGVDPNPIALMIPILTFAIVFGLSMDYEVFLISRIQEIYLETGDNDKATLEGLTTTSKIITSAAAIMIAVTGAFAFTDIVPVKQIGVGVALAIFIDATLVRMVLVPSLMKLLGKWNWWFPGQKRAKKSNN